MARLRRTAALLGCVVLTLLAGIPESQAQVAQDLPAGNHGKHYVMKLSLLSQLDLYNIRSAQPAKADLSTPGRYYLVVFLRSDLTVGAIHDLTVIRHIADQYTPSRLSVDYVFTKSSEDSVLDLVRAGLLAQTSDVYLDRAEGVTSELHIPTSFPFAFLIRGRTGEIVYSWGTPIEGLAKIFEQALK